jgi:hypothetical protein
VLGSLAAAPAWDVTLIKPSIKKKSPPPPGQRSININRVHSQIGMFYGQFARKEFTPSWPKVALECLFSEKTSNELERINIPIWNIEASRT